MRALGRILQIAGWLWFVGAIGGSILGFDRLSVFPGIILIFFARVLRAQSGRGDSGQPTGQEPESEQVPDRILNTERSQQPPGPLARPEVTYLPPAPTPEPVRDPSEEMREERDDILERIAAAADREAAEQPEPSEPTPLDIRPGGRKHISSEEMIARAHRRWDSKGR